MTFPGFPPGLPRLIPNAPELSASDRAYVDGLPLHKQAEAERTLRNLAAIFANAAFDPRAKILSVRKQIEDERVEFRKIAGVGR